MEEIRWFLRLAQVFATQRREVGKFSLKRNTDEEEWAGKSSRKENKCIKLLREGVPVDAQSAVCK
jgi:hypothetical protein